MAAVENSLFLTVAWITFEPVPPFLQKLASHSLAGLRLLSLHRVLLQGGPAEFSAALDLRSRAASDRTAVLYRLLQPGLGVLPRPSSSRSCWARERLLPLPDRLSGAAGHPHRLMQTSLAQRQTCHQPNPQDHDRCSQISSQQCSTKLTQRHPCAVAAPIAALAARHHLIRITVVSRGNTCNDKLIVKHGRPHPMYGHRGDFQAIRS